MRKAFLLLSLFVCIIARAQETKSKHKFDVENLFVGGSISVGLDGFGSGFFAGIHPHVGYTLAKWIDAGIALNFEYSSVKDSYNNKYHNTTYGIGTFVRIYPVNFLFIQAEPEFNTVALKYIPDQGDIQRLTLHPTSLLLGIGYVTERDDKNTFSYFSLLIDVLKDPNSPYIDANGNFIPIIRGGLNIGIRKKHKVRRRVE